MFPYLTVMFVLIFIWVIILFLFPNLREKIIFSSSIYVILLVPTFWTHYILLKFLNISPLYNPAYWVAETLFNIHNLTGGFSIEDVLFMIGFGGIVPILYESIFKIKEVKEIKKKSLLPLIVFLISYFLLALTKINPIYLLIIPSFFGAISIWIIRKDMIKNSIVSGISMTLIYFIGLLIFNQFYPDFITNHIKYINQPFILGVPLTEILYGLSFGLMWGPIYNVIFGYTYKK